MTYNVLCGTLSLYTTTAMFLIHAIHAVFGLSHAYEPGMPL